MLVYQRVYFLEQTSEYKQLELPAPPSDEYRLTRASQSPCPMRPLRPLPWEGQGKVMSVWHPWWNKWPLDAPKLESLRLRLRMSTVTSVENQQLWDFGLYWNVVVEGRSGFDSQLEAPKPLESQVFWNVWDQSDISSPYAWECWGWIWEWFGDYRSSSVRSLSMFHWQVNKCVASRQPLIWIEHVNKHAETSWKIQVAFAFSFSFPIFIASIILSLAFALDLAGKIKKGESDWELTVTKSEGLRWFADLGVKNQKSVH